MMVVSLLVTWFGYQVGVWLAKRTKLPLINPVVVGATIVLLYLRFGHVPYTLFKQHTSIITFALGPAVVALALPLHERVGILKQNRSSVLSGVAACALFTIIGGLIAGKLINISPDFTFALAARSLTSAIAISSALGSHHAPVLAGATAILAGMIGGTIGPWLLDRFQVTSPVARGLAMGTVSGGIGTARILKESEEAGAAGALGMCLNGVLTSALLAIFWRYCEG